LGDIAVPGLLAGLALRYDASRAVDMNGRAQAAGAAMHRALALLKVQSLPLGARAASHTAQQV
jgi:minor histocompatibility antigen H13